jgi:probable rRNA maturation factor
VQPQEAPAPRTMILLDPQLDLGPPRKRPGLSELPVLRDAASEPSSKAAAPRAGWRRSALPWAERLPTPRTLARFLAQAQDAAGLRGQVNVLLTTDAAIRDLNRRFRGKDKATDVLSFPAAPLQSAKPAERVAGDIAISVETARCQATEQGHALTCELKVLILHGVLHLAGYDHESDTGRMQRRERDLRAQLGLPLGLIERASSRRSTRPKLRRTAGARTR